MAKLRLEVPMSRRHACTTTINVLRRPVEPAIYTALTFFSMK
jgi:hypothetical protein